MKILLVNPPGWQKGSVNLGLSSLASSLISSGHEVKIFDINATNQSPEIVANRAKRYAPDIIGFSVKTATVHSASVISESIKKVYSPALHVAGGPHITLSSEEFLTRNPTFAYGFLGECEQSFSEFVSRIEANQDVHNVPGIVCRNRSQNGFVITPIRIIGNLDLLPLPNFEVVDIFQPENFRYPLLTSRGCPYLCIYCCVGLISSKKWRARSPEKIIEELQWAKKRYQIKNFEILDDNFTFQSDRAKAFCRLLIEKKLGLQWYCHNGIRADKFDLELARLMRKAGCTSVALGIESGDKEIFNSLKKGENLEDIIRAVEIIKKVGMRVVGYFIIGLPGDSLEGIQRTIQFQEKLKLDDFKYGILNPYPGTSVWKMIQEHGRMLLDIKDSYHFCDVPTVSYELPGFSQNEIEQAYYSANFWDLHKTKEWLKHRYGKERLRVLYVDLFPSGDFLPIIKKVLGECIFDVLSSQRNCQDYLAKKDSGEISSLYIPQPSSNKLIKSVKGLKYCYLFRQNKYDIIFYNTLSSKIFAIAILIIVSPGCLFFVEPQFNVIRFSWRKKIVWKKYILAQIPALSVKLGRLVLDITLYFIFRFFTLFFGLLLYLKRDGKKVIFTKDGPKIVALNKRDENITHL